MRSRAVLLLIHGRVFLRYMGHKLARQVTPLLGFLNSNLHLQSRNDLRILDRPIFVLAGLCLQVCLLQDHLFLELELLL